MASNGAHIPHRKPAMFERLRSVFARSQGAVNNQGIATPGQLALWAGAQRWSFDFQGEPARFQLGGMVAGQPWLLESGPPTRDYLTGTELRARTDPHAAPDVCVMVISRALKETLEGRVYGAITETLQTAVDESLPQEMRWLAMYDELQWPELPPSFARLFAVVGERSEQARRWVNAALVSHLLGSRSATQAALPLVLMLSGGKLSLRMQTMACYLPDLEYATALLVVATTVAAQNLPATAESGPATLPPG